MGKGAGLSPGASSEPPQPRERGSRSPPRAPKPPRLPLPVLVGSSLFGHLLLEELLRLLPAQEHPGALGERRHQAHLPQAVARPLSIHPARGQREQGSEGTNPKGNSPAASTGHRAEDGATSERFRGRGAPPDPLFSPLGHVCQVPAGPGVAVAARLAVGVGGSAQVSVVLRGILRAVPAVRLLPAAPGQPRLVARCRDSNGKPGSDATAPGGAQNTPGHCQTPPAAALKRVVRDTPRVL